MLATSVISFKTIKRTEGREPTKGEHETVVMRGVEGMAQREEKDEIIEMSHLCVSS